MCVTEKCVIEPEITLQRCLLFVNKPKNGKIFVSMKKIDNDRAILAKLENS